MKILVMGGGVVGVTTAYRLLGDGHEVTLVERHPEAAQGTSFANAGMIATGHAYAWSSPTAPRILLRSLYRKDQALRFRPSLDPALWRWSLLFLRQCTNARARINTLRKHRLCVYSQAALQEVVGETGIVYDAQRSGILYLCRSARSFDAAVAKMGILVEDGQRLEVLDRDQVARIEPALAPIKESIAGAIHAPTDETGDARIFTQSLAALCAERGATFHYATTIRRIATEGDRVIKVVTDTRDRFADLYVMALGCESPIAARRIGVKLPIYPIKGYSVTLPLGGPGGAPRLACIDEDDLVAVTPLGDRLRIAATAEFAGYDTGHKPSDFKAMLSTARELYPEGGDYDQPSYWAGLRPMTPEGTPIFGLGRHKNLYYNTGQGHMGWTMACGSARITADLIASRTPGIPLDGMLLARS